MQFIFILCRSIMVHRLSSLNSCFEANQGWYVFNLSFHYETVSLPRSLQVRKLCLPTQEIPLQQLPQKGNFPQKWAQLMPLSRAVWRGCGMRAPRTALPALGSAALPSSSPLPGDSQECSQGTRHCFLPEKNNLREAQDTQSCQRAEEEEGEL